MERAVQIWVRYRWDAEAGVWYVCDSNVPGLSAEAPTPEEMEARLSVLVPELLQLNRPEQCDDGRKAPINLVIKSSKELELVC